MKIKEAQMLDLNLLKSNLYNTSVLLLVKTTLTEQTTNLQNLMIDTAIEVHHVIVIQIVKLHHKIDIALTLETDADKTEVLLLHNITDLDMTFIEEIHGLIVHHTDLHLDHHIDEIHVLDINHVHSMEIDNFHNILRHINLLLNHESLDLLDQDQILQQKMKPVPFKQNNQTHLLTLKSICTTLQK